MNAYDKIWVALLSQSWCGLAQGKPPAPSVLPAARFMIFRGRCGMKIMLRSSQKKTVGLILSLFILGMMPSPSEAFEVEYDLGFFNRLTIKQNDVERLLRYDDSIRAFDTSSYLAPKRDQVYYSLMLSAGLYLELSRWLAVGIAVDSGEFNPMDRVPLATTVPLTGLRTLLQKYPIRAQILSQIEDPQVLSTKDKHQVSSNGLPIGDEAQNTFFIRQAFFQLAAPETEWLTFRFGRLAGEAGESFIYNDFGLGMQGVADLDRLNETPLKFSLQALLPSRGWTSGFHSPLLELRADYLFSSVLSMIESLGLVVAYFHDGDDNFGQFFYPAIEESAVIVQQNSWTVNHGEVYSLMLSTGSRSRADIAWFGIDGNKLFGDLELSVTFLVEVGRLRLDNPFEVLFYLFPYANLPSQIPRNETIALSTLGWAVDAHAQYLLSDTVTLGGFFLFLSGEENPFLAGGKMDTYSSFLGVMPYLTYTNLFFFGGMNESFSGRHATSAGVNSRGVIAAGTTLTWEITDTLSTQVKGAGLWSAVSSFTGGRFYGVEGDVEISYTPFDLLRLSLEYDVIGTGSFFQQQGLVHKMIVGVDLMM